MGNAKEVIISKLEDLHIKLFYGSDYSVSAEGMYDRLRDRLEYDALLNLVRNAEEWDEKEISKEVSDRVFRQMSLHG